MLASSAQILDRLQWQADQRIMLLLDNWNDPELALDLARYLDIYIDRKCVAKTMWMNILDTSTIAQSV